MLAPTIESIAEQYSGTSTVVKVNVDDNPEIAAAYGIRGIPTLILFNEGQEVERIVGAAGKEAISDVIERHINLPTSQSLIA
jgi:thioredoxin 1